MKTLIIHGVPSDQLETLKSAAKANHQSLEAQAKTIIEEAVVAKTHHTTSEELFAQCRTLLEDGGLGPNEELVPPREKDDARPVSFH
ncbi:hypothetical protein PT282_06725 [Bifidobacterium sp. ESL0763]|uniref:FitA-like ribbon-helix-helix domain-containing protein n=1 Tax=Bifidobacterium sp. ESL0763 TaxID=2983227 RepID=UPI0023F962B8|nr:hypothetical protein [Bifidobacterium sp. ESL0763]MDF7664350.1 hypothetical protein [Bifidobacterium sp. ESL0763]